MLFALGVGSGAADAGEPLRLARITVVDGVENEFDAGRDAKFFKNTEEILFDRMLAEVEFAGGGAVAETFGDQSHHLCFAGREQQAAFGIDHSQRGRL